MSSSLSQHRSPTPMSSQHLSPQQHSPHASSISSAPVSRPSSPASIILASTTPVLSPPHSPKSSRSQTMNLSGSPSIGSPPTSPGTSSSNNKLNSIVSLSTQFQQQQYPNSTSALPTSDFSTHSATLFSFETINSLLFQQPITRIVVVLTVLHSLLGLGDKFPGHCSAPSYTLYGGEYLGLLISPFVVPLTPTLLKSAHQTLGIAVMLAISNLISFGLFEERLTTLFRGNRSKRSNTSINHNSTRIFRNLVLVIVALVMGLRQLLGFIFDRALGWSCPFLFFSESVNECNLGRFPNHI